MHLTINLLRVAILTPTTAYVASQWNRAIWCEMLSRDLPVAVSSFADIRATQAYTIFQLRFLTFNVINPLNTELNPICQ